MKYFFLFVKTVINNDTSQWMLSDVNGHLLDQLQNIQTYPNNNISIQSRIFMSQQGAKAALRRAKQMHIQLKIQAEDLEKYLDYLKIKASEKPKFVPCGGCLGNKIDINPSFMRAFSTLTQMQRANFYLKNVLIARDIIENREQYISIIPSGNRSTTWSFFNESEKQWETKSIQINFTKLTIKFKSTKEEIDLHNYIVRASKKKDSERKILALESIETLQLPQTLRLSNYKETFDELKDLMENMIDEGIKENLSRMAAIEPRAPKSQNNLKLSKRQQKQVPELSLQKENSDVLIKVPDEDEPDLSIKTPTRVSPIFPARRTETMPFQSQYQKLKSKLINSLTNEQNLEQYRKNVLINLKENRVRKIFQYRQEDSSLPFEWFSDNFMINSCFRRWKKTLKESRTLSYNQKSHIKIFYEKHEYKDQSRVSYIYKRQKISTSPNCIYFIDTPVEEGNYEPVNGKIQYIIWKFEKKSDRLIINAQSKIIHSKTKLGYPSIQLSDEFMGSMDYICMNLNMTLGFQTDFNINSVMFEEQYLSQIDNFNDVEDNDMFYTIIDDSPEPDQLVSPQKLRESAHKISEATPYTFRALTKTEYFAQPNVTKLLKFKHPQVPFEKGKPHYKYPIKQGQHPYFENEFLINKDGEMISINEAKLKAQSSVLKGVLKTISKNIFSGKSILNISLPVTVFSVESNLSLLCRSYSYAPTLLQKASKEKNPVDRLKWVAAFATTLTVAYLQMDKPFNPILGETFQAVFDGCLIYGEQIAHHPPISATYMVGRGYKLYGSFEAKVNMSINTATGSNDGVLTIEFDDERLKKNVYKVTVPPGQVSGLAFGVRKVAATQKSYIYDTNNRVYVELNFNRHKGTTQYCKFYDGIQGKVVKLSPNADQKNLGKMNKKFFVEQYGMISGRWTNEIYYDDELLFNSWEDMAHGYEKYPCSLESDAYFRKDLNLRVAQDYEAAQEAKEELEIIQRNDRALRKKYTGKDH